MLGKRAEFYVDERTKEQQRRESDENVEDLSQIHEDVPKYKKIPNISKKKFEAMKRREKSIEERYTPVRAPYKKKAAKEEEPLKLYRSEKKARKDPNYDILSNEELEEIDEENTTPNPHVVGGAVKDKK